MKLYPFCDVDDEHKTAIDDTVCFVRHVYAHGKLEAMAHYDIIGRSKDDEFDYSTKRIEKVDAVLYDGTVVPAILYYWVHRGLLVAADDQEARAYAQESYDNDVDCI